MPRQGRSGWIRGEITIPSVSNAVANPHFDQTGALTIVNSLDPGRRMILEAIGFVTSIKAGASAGSQVFKLRKGGASGTVVATLTIPYTSADALGEVIEATVSGSIPDCTLEDGDTLSVTRDSGGTDYTTKPEGHFYIRYRERPQQAD